MPTVKRVPASTPSLPRGTSAPPRAVVDAVLPNIDDGRYAAKCTVGTPLEVEAHCFADGHDKLRVVLRWWREGETTVREVEMVHRGNDEWFASCAPEAPGRYLYTVVAWVDAFLSWRADFARRVEAEDLRVAALSGAELIEQAALRADRSARKPLKDWAAALRKRTGDADTAALQALALDDASARTMALYPDRRFAASGPDLPLDVDRERAQFSSWYELFPRSTSPVAGRHGTFADVEARLPYVAALGFDVLYFPPIHPIGRTHRKGRDNALSAQPEDVGSPWAIGAAEGGHKDVLSELGTLEDFRRLVEAAATHGIEIALDIAFQCSPDHPYVTNHPQWFKARPDGSIQYAENPPKKYQDIYPFDFETEDWAALWAELRSVFEHWIAQGVKIFRVDNPHTKAFAFWEWVIREIRRQHPDVLFLAEAFTRPKVMHRLAKLGFSQSYTYFTWRNTRQELVEYFTELSQGPGKDYYRPNAWPNTPDILNEHLHGGGAPIFSLRLLLAATLSASYGLYGPAYELMENEPRSAGSEEYLHSEKYELRHWDLERADSLRGLISRVNRIRHENKALHALAPLHFVRTDNEQLLAYVKRSRDDSNLLLVVVNLDPLHRQSGWIELDAQALPLELSMPYQVHDLLGGQRYMWQGPRNFVILDPAQSPGHVFRVHQQLRAELQFDASH